MKPKKRTFTIVRNGFFITDRFTQFQCTVEGWDTYRYELLVTGSPKWDENGFLVDHNHLHKTILEFILDNDMKSCEMVLEGLCDKLIQECTEKKVELKRLELSLFPVHSDNVRIVDGQLRQVKFPKMQMPAFGKYICEF